VQLTAARRTAGGGVQPGPGPGGPPNTARGAQCAEPVTGSSGDAAFAGQRNGRRKIASGIGRPPGDDPIPADRRAVTFAKSGRKGADRGFVRHDSEQIEI